jgi:hypothetical protein
LQGANFISDEKMTNYTVNNTKGAFPVGDMTGENENDTATVKPTNPNSSPAASPAPKRPVTQPFAAKNKLTP